MSQSEPFEKTGRVEPDRTPSVVSGRKSTAVIAGEAVVKGEQTQEGRLKKASAALVEGEE
jgi:hypothetical protein